MPVSSATRAASSRPSTRTRTAEHPAAAPAGRTTSTISAGTAIIVFARFSSRTRPASSIPSTTKRGSFTVRATRSDSMSFSSGGVAASMLCGTT